MIRRSPRVTLGLAVERGVSADLPGEAKGKAASHRSLEERLRPYLGPASAVVPTAVFLAVWAYLNAFVNLRYPYGEPFLFAYLLPSIEITVLLLVLCGLAFLGRVLPKWAFMVVAFLLLPLRFVRSADPMALATYGRPFSWAADSDELWSLLLFLDDAASRTGLMVGVAVSALVLGAALFLVRQGLIMAHNYFVKPTHRYLFGGLLGVFLLASLVLPSAEPGTRVGAFAEPAVPRFFAILGSRGEAEQARAALRQAVSTRPPLFGAELVKDALGGRDVHLIRLATYGNAVFEEPFARELAPTLARVEPSLSESGYTMYTGRLEAPVLGGKTELARATLLSGVRVTAPPALEALAAEPPTMLPDPFDEAGYATMLVLPGVSREEEREAKAYLGFASLYRSWELGYQGPAFGRIPVPDQYVLDVIWRREVEHGTRPLFVQYDLVGTRLPWDTRVPYLDDWTTIIDGAVYEGLDAQTTEVTWPDLSGARLAYPRAIAHAFEVLEGYLTDRVPDPMPGRRVQGRRRRMPPPLVFVVGDQQPPAELLRTADDRSVPLHVLSRTESLVTAFADHGFVSGLTPDASRPPIPTEDFPRLLADVWSAEASDRHPPPRSR